MLMIKLINVNDNVHFYFWIVLYSMLAGGFMVWCVMDWVWWAALCQKVQGHYLAQSAPPPYHSTSLMSYKTSISTQ